MQDAKLSTLTKGITHHPSSHLHRFKSPIPQIGVVNSNNKIATDYGTTPDVIPTWQHHHEGVYFEHGKQNSEDLHKKIVVEIESLRGFFSPEVGQARKSEDEAREKEDEARENEDEAKKNEDLAWMLFVDGCAVLQIIEKTNLFKPEDLKVKVDIVSIARDLFLNMFTASESLHSLPLGELDQHRIEELMNNPSPTHLLDCLRKVILSNGIDSVGKDEKYLSDQCQLNVHHLQETRLDVAFTNANKKERYISYRNILELKSAAIRVKRQQNISLKNISFSSSFFGGKLHLPPLVLNDSSVSTLLNWLAYEMCPLFKNEFEICSYVKFLDLLIDHQEDVKELRSSGIIHNSLGSDEEVVELLNTISSGLVHNPAIYSGIKNEVEKHYKKTLSIWMAEAYYTYFKSPWTIIAFLAALIALVLTALQTWLAFKSNYNYHGI
ncbi:hypothetical protein L6164_007779 [Bauhinia variegata]|uniref:Uncharacterized protein n=1 Tax=Bauhinia variegata TaxID=167791 RepID=A0ACB9PET2_BAUVA|nr:hypothetical protein L6164_007779 [Bauhinia variegata]